MSTQAAGATSTPAGQAGAGVPPAADATKTESSTPAKETAKEAKPPASLLSDTEPGEEKGEQGAQGGESKDGKPDQAGELEIKIPDGAAIDPQAFAEFKGMAKEMGLTGEHASKLVAWQLQRQQAANEADVKAWEKRGEDWKAEIEKDPEYGGEKLKQTVSDAQKALRKWGGDALVKTIVDLGLGNQPDLIRTFAKIQQADKEDSSAVNADADKKPAKQTEQELLRKTYPSMFNADGSPKK